MPSQNVLLVTWTWPSIRIRPLRREGLHWPRSSGSAATAVETSELPAAASAPAPRLRRAERLVIFESVMRVPPGDERFGQLLLRGPDVPAGAEIAGAISARGCPLRSSCARPRSKSRRAAPETDARWATSRGRRRVALVEEQPNRTLQVQPRPSS